jgi:hypothetical protein
MATPTRIICLDPDHDPDLGYPVSPSAPKYAHLQAAPVWGVADVTVESAKPEDWVFTWLATGLTASEAEDW